MHYACTMHALRMHYVAHTRIWKHSFTLTLCLLCCRYDSKAQPHKPGTFHIYNPEERQAFKGTVTLDNENVEQYYTFSYTIEREGSNGAWIQLAGLDNYVTGM